MNTQRPLILTSLAPAHFDRQQAAIKSWLDAGFEVWSLNLPEEFEKIQDYAGVEFKQATRDSRAITGKPLVFFDDMMGLLMTSNRKVAGIVNSDIVLSCPKLIEQLETHCKLNTLLFGCRVDVKNARDRSGDVYPMGFDYFFFGQQARTCFKRIPSQFAIGAPWWDYWAILVPMLAGAEVRSIVSPIGFHEIHSRAWKNDLFRSYAKELSEKLTELGWCPDVQSYIAEERGPAVALSSRCAEMIHRKTGPDCRFQSAPGELSLAAQYSSSHPKVKNRSDRYHNFITSLCADYLKRCTSA